MAVRENITDRAYFLSVSPQAKGMSAEEHWTAARNQLVNERVDRRLARWKGLPAARIESLRERFWMEEHEFVGWLEWVDKHLGRTYLSIEAAEDPTDIDYHVRQHVDQQGHTAPICDLLLVAMVLDGSAEHSRHLWKLHAGDETVSALIEQKDQTFVRYAKQAIREMGGSELEKQGTRRFQDGCVACFGVQSDESVVRVLRCAARLRRDLTYRNQTNSLNWQSQLHMRVAVATTTPALAHALGSARQNEIALESTLVEEVAEKHPELVKFLIDDGLQLVSEKFRTRRSNMEQRQGSARNEER